MHTLDLVIILVLAAGLVRGFSTGVIKQIASIVGVLIGFALAVQLMHSVGGAVAGSLGVADSVAPLIGFVLVFLGVQIGILALTRIAETLIGALKLTVVNRALGGVVGAAKAAVALSVLFLVLGYFGVPAQDTQRQSELYHPIAAALPQAWNYASDYLPQVQRLADRFTRHIEEQLPSAGD